MARGQKNTVESILKRVIHCEHSWQCKECCWLWQGGLDKHGYGKVIYNGKTISPHRIIFQAVKNVVLSRNQLVLHTCDIKRCCNWNHLYIGNKSQNALDSYERGQLQKGERSKVAKLNLKQVQEMRLTYSSHLMNQTELSIKYGISKSQVQRIVRFEDWKE